MRQAKVIQLRAKEKLAQSKYLLEESRSIATKYLPTLLQRMLDNADDFLFEMADKALSNQEQNTYFDAMRELRRLRGSLESGFKQHLNANFNKFQSSTNYEINEELVCELDFNEMSLVDENELEESLAITGMVGKIKNRYPHELYAIEQRFQAISGNEKPGIDEIPIGPKPICLAFDESVKSLNCNIQIKLIIYKLFDKHVLANMQALYDEINVLFISAGVLPKLKMRVQKQPGSYVSKAKVDDASWLDDSSVSPTQNSLDSGAGYREVAQPPSTFTTLRNLLNSHQRGGISQQPVFEQSSASIQDQAEVIETLSNLQQLNLTTSVEVFQTEISKLKSAGKISTVDNDIINIVDMLFDFILDDDNLPTITKALLARLQIPTIKIALVDREFFGKKNHPAKLLLNMMAKSTVGLSNDISTENCALIKKIETIVNKICTNFINDVAIFDEFLDEFEQFIQEESSNDIQSQEISKQRIEEREQHALSSAWVTDVIASIINNKMLPKTVFELLDGPWKEVMVNTYLNDGENSDHWKENLRFIDLLVWSVEPTNSNADKQRLSRIIPELIKTLHHELEAVYYPPAKVDELLTNLGHIHITALRGEKVANQENVRVKAKPIDEIEPIDDEFERINNELDAMRENLTDIVDIDDIMGDVMTDINPDNDPAEIARKQAIISELFDADVEEIVMATDLTSEKTIPEIDDQHWASVQLVKPGQWINLIDSKGKTQKIKLAWKSDMLGECTFTNWKFKVVADFSFNQLAAKFRCGQASMINNLPIFERAIDAMVNTLQRSQPSEA